MSKRFKEWFSIQQVKNPGRIVLCAILLFNVLFFFVSAGIIALMSLEGTEHMNFVSAMFCTITMILDAGCIQFVINDIGMSNVIITIVCLIIILIGMISFTGAVIGYVTNYISNYIESANSGRKKLFSSNHFVLLNWNTRASEIVNDLIYCEGKQTVVVLVSSNKEEIEKEIDERLNDTISQENKSVEERYANLPFIKRHFAIKKHKLHKHITVIVREGDIFSLKQLNDISLERAKAVIILENEITRTVCKYEQNEKREELSRGNTQTVKTLMQVADITSAQNSFDNQKIIVEVTDPWTWDLVEKIIKAKQVDGKCNIIPVRINEVLGQILSQFCIMPELNSVYSELLSYRGAEFFAVEQPYQEEINFLKNFLKDHNEALPLTVMKQGDKSYSYYVANSLKDLTKKSNVSSSDYKVDLVEDYWIQRRNVLILGHNSKCKNIMAGFKSFSDEWKRGEEEIVRLVVIDDKQSLERMNYYKEYPFVAETVVADVYEKELICSTIEKFISNEKEDVSILILSDDMVVGENIDASALANLVFVRDIIERKKKEAPNFDFGKVDVIVEIIDPKHHDIVNSYNVNNVVISNRYISKMVTQISEFEALFDFYNDILSYDEEGADTYSSKEVYVKKVYRYFNSVPEPTTADKFVRAVFEQSIDTNKFAVPNPTIPIGYVKVDGEVVLFGGDLTKIEVALSQYDKVILFAAH